MLLTEKDLLDKNLNHHISHSAIIDIKDSIQQAIPVDYFNIDLIHNEAIFNTIRLSILYCIERRLYSQSVIIVNDATK